MSPRRSWLRRVGLAAAGALLTTAPVILADEANDAAGSASHQALLAARAWSDLLPGQSSPLLPAPGATESAIVVLSAPAIGQVDSANAADAVRAIDAQHALFEQALGAVAGRITFSYRVLVNGVGVQVPTGRLAQVADLPGVVAVYPVTFLSPAQVSSGTPQPLPRSATVPPQQASTGPRPPLTIALIDAGVEPRHPMLGGGIGLDRLIIGGADLVDGNPTPEAPAARRETEAHGTELAGLVLGSPLLSGLSPDRIPRMRSYRVLADEAIDGRTTLLARSDRVLAAMELAADPDGNGDPSDHASVILLGVAGQGMSGGSDPLSQAAAAADRIGSLIVAPVGNAGPGALDELGTVGPPASSDHVLSVGGLSAASTPRMARLDLAVGPADAHLDDLPLLGPAPPAGLHRVVVLAGIDGVSSGTDVREYTDAAGQSRVQGAIVVVGRGGGTLQQKARAAAQAGAAAVMVWDQDGSGMFPGVHADGELALPLIGLGPAQGRLVMERSDLQVRIVASAVRQLAAGVATFSGRGPDAAGASAPDVVAPAVDVATAYPGPGVEAMTVRMSGTSAAAAQVAAMALRFREDNPRLDPADVRSLFAQSAEPVPGATIAAQGAGIARAPVLAPVAVEPGVIAVRRLESGPTTVTVDLHELAGTERQVRLAVTDAFGTPIVQPGRPVTLPADGRATATIAVPAGDGAFNGIVHVVGPDRTVLASAPLMLASAPRRSVALGRVVVRTESTGVRARVRVRARVAGGTVGVHDLRLTLVPVDGGAAIALSDSRVVSEWPVGQYEFAIVKRDVNGRPIRSGRYRLRVEAIGPDAVPLRSSSVTFDLHR